MSDFSDKPFVAGSLIGLRAFAVDSLGRLVGPSQGGVFKPGENEAECLSIGSLSVPSGAEVTWQTWSPSWGDQSATFQLNLPDGSSVTYPDVEALKRDYPAAKHHVGTHGCTCGYYAYFDGSNDYHKDNRVAALIEGYGTCTVGSRGFRASKARLQALIIPATVDVAPEQRSRLSVLADWANGFGLAFNAALACVWTARGVWLAAVLHLAVMAFIATCAWVTRRSRKRLAAIRADARRRSGSAVLDPHMVALIRRNYPDVPVFPTVKAALAKFPLTPPPEPTPEDEDFWTREVSA